MPLILTRCFGIMYFVGSRIIVTYMFQVPYFPLLKSTLEVSQRKWRRNGPLKVHLLQLQVQSIQLHKHYEVGK